jgi:hypothetical protein
MSSEAPDSRPAGLNPDILWRVVGDEALLLDTISGNYFSLDPIATRIWNGLVKGESAESIASEIAESYSIDTARARSDIDDLIADLKNANIWR